MKSLNGHLFTAVDLETTGGDEFEYEPVQIAAVPVDHQTLEVHTELQPFVSFIRPRRPDVFQPEAMVAHGFSMEQIMDEGLEFDEFLVQWDDWFRSLELKHKGGLIPIAHNYLFELSYLRKMFGYDGVYDYFHYKPRDTMIIASYLNDIYDFHGQEVPFEQMKLGTILNYWGIQNDRAHDAYYDCLAEVQLYKAMVTI